MAVFDVWGRVAQTGSGNKWPLLAFTCARLEQIGDMLTFPKGLRLLFYGTASLSHWHWPCSTCGVASRKPEVEINGRWWRLRVLFWNNLQTCCHFVNVWGFYFMAPLLCPIDIGRVRRVGSPRGNRKWK